VTEGAPQGQPPLEPGQSQPDRRRLSIAAAHQALQEAVARTGDVTLGLKAARTRVPGDAGAIEYAMHCAATVQDALNVGARFIRLLNDALEIHTERRGSQALVRLESRVALPIVAEDFMVGVFYRIHVRRLLSKPSEVECWFQHDPPEDASEYVETLAPARFRFRAPCSGFAFPSRWLSAPLPMADAKLHFILLEHMEQSLAELPYTRTVTDHVRQLISDKLPRVRITAADIAAGLRMSERTLARKLESEGTTFGHVLDDTRRRRAIRYLDDGRLTIDEITFLLGFSQSTAFYRAFRRWTGTTPQQYRDAACRRSE
jgi:AraC-like DNA-binding protein